MAKREKFQKTNAMRELEALLYTVKVNKKSNKNQ